MNDVMEATVGIRALHGMIRLFVARLRPESVSTSLKSLPALCGTYRDLHTVVADYDSEVENTSLLRTVSNRASEYANLRSEVSPHECRPNQIPTECVDSSCREMIPRKMVLHVLNG